ncbi:hypothetical protein FS749_000546 [Ceratobasidium sp. UAMH 11750]|nr:hypothetical protein FS749_000546 [Ceratobasidium sp. UAMH 11750]
MAAATETPFVTRTEHFVTVGCALAALLSDPDASPDSPLVPLPESQYRRAIGLLSPGRRFEDADADLQAMHKALDDAFIEGLRKAANDITNRKNELQALVTEWESKDEATRGPEPSAIRMARTGVMVATAVVNATANSLDIPADTTRGKLAILVVEKMGFLGLLEASKVSKDGTFEATRIVLQYYKVI